MMASDRYRRWFAYEKDSHRRVIDSLAAVPEEQRDSPTFHKAVDLLAHIAAARALWLFRLGILPDAPATPFPRDAPVAEVRAHLEKIQQCWDSYLAGIDEGELARVLEYQSLEGEWYRSTVEDILTQLFGHSSYHRGQVAALVRSLGAEPAVTDFVVWSREEIPAPRQKTHGIAKVEPTAGD